MIPFIRNWLDARRREKERTSFCRGYGWARNALKNEIYTVPALRAFADGTFNHDPYNRAFDHGVNAACDELEIPNLLR